jgi:hypothetical protein
VGRGRVGCFLCVIVGPSKRLDWKIRMRGGGEGRRRNLKLELLSFYCTGPCLVTIPRVANSLLLRGPSSRFWGMHVTSADKYLRILVQSRSTNPAHWVAAPGRRTESAPSGRSRFRTARGVADDAVDQRQTDRANQAAAKAVARRHVL